MKTLTFYRLMRYTCKVKCYDGVVRSFEHMGYFIDTDVLRHHLAGWNGCPGPAGEPYQYFETLEQVHHNDGVCCGPVPSEALCYYGSQQHDYEILSENR